MKENTNNKIFVCWNCYGPLTGEQTQFCANNMCESAWNKKQATRDLGKIKIWVYLNKAMVELAKGERVEPHALSGFISTGHDLMAVAQYDEADLESISDAECNTYDAYWRGLNRLNISIEPHHPINMRKQGMLSYLCDNWGISTEKNVAAAIGELVVLEGHRTPVAFFNSL